MCQYNKATSTYDENYVWYWNRFTYEDDYNMMLYGAIGMSACWSIQVLCCCIPCCQTPATEYRSRGGINEEKYNDRETDLSELVVVP